MISLDLVKNRVIVKFPYSDHLVLAMKEIDGGKFRKEPDIGPHWRFPLTKLGQLMQEFPDAWLEPRIANYVKTSQESERLKALPDAPQPLGLMINLRRHQRIAVNFLSRLPKVLCTPGVGTGKTFIGIAWVRNFVEAFLPRYGVLVVTKSVGKYKYMSEIFRAMPNAHIAVIEGETGPFPESRDVDWVIINWDLLWARREQIKAFGFAAVIFSEAHKMKAGQGSLRGKASLELSQDIPAIMLETASPIRNRNSELFPLLCVLGYLDEKDDFWSYHMRFCIDPEHPKKKISWRGKMVWDFSHSRNSEELHHLIAPFTYTITKEQALPDLPEVYFTPMLVSAENMGEYEEASENFLEWVYEKRGVGGVMRAEKALALVRLGALLQLAAEGVTADASEFLETYLDARQKVVVFSSFTKPLDDLYAKFKDVSVKITGGENAKEQFASQESFQKDDSILLALCATQAAGESITLTAASTCIFLSLPWSPEDFSQAYGRLHRDGQKNAVEVVVFMARHTVQVEQVEVLYGKSIDVSKVVTGKDRSTNSEALKKILLEVKGVDIKEDLGAPLQATR